MKGIIGLDKVKAKKIDTLLKTAGFKLPHNDLAKRVSYAINSNKDGNYVLITRGLHYSGNQLHFDCRVIMNNQQITVSDLHVFIHVIVVQTKSGISMNNRGSVSINDECLCKTEIHLIDITGY